MSLYILDTDHVTLYRYGHAAVAVRQQLQHRHDFVVRLRRVEIGGGGN